MDKELLHQAMAAREWAYAPYSNFRVGAALRTAAGEIIRGCNIENTSIGHSMCAERVALFKAVSEAKGPVTDLAVVAAPRKEPVTPCGACRQVMQELAPEANVYLSNEDGTKVLELTTADLIPYPFQR